MYRIAFLCLMASTLLAREPLRLLVLEAQPINPYITVTDAILHELSLKGYKNGNNLIVERHILGNYEGRGISILRAFQDSSFHVIVLNGTIAGIAARSFLEQNPMESKKNRQFVFVNITDPVGIGLVPELNKPTSGNFTGIAYPVPVADRLRLVMKIFGNSARVGFIYSSMPQSLSYKQWLDPLLASNEFKSLRFEFRQVPFIKSDGGIERMAMLSVPHIRELDSIVDVFLSPNDQLGASNEFGSRMLQFGTKPLFGLANETGSAIALTPDLEAVGRDAANMILGIYHGKKAKDFLPHSPNAKLYRNEKIRLPK